MAFSLWPLFSEVYWFNFICLVNVKLLDFSTYSYTDNWKPAGFHKIPQNHKSQPIYLLKLCICDFCIMLTIGSGRKCIFPMYKGWLCKKIPHDHLVIWTHPFACDWKYVSAWILPLLFLMIGDKILWITDEIRRRKQGTDTKCLRGTQNRNFWQTHEHQCVRASQI